MVCIETKWMFSQVWDFKGDPGMPWNESRSWILWKDIMDFKNWNEGVGIPGRAKIISKYSDWDQVWYI